MVNTLTSFSKRTLTTTLGFLIGTVSLAAVARGHEKAEEATIPPPAVCFAPGTPIELVQQTYERMASSRQINSLAPLEGPDYVLGSRWTATATDGGGLGQGDPTTLTWSVVPDGTWISGDVGEPASASTVRAYFTGIYGSYTAWIAVLQEVFDRWGELTGITYVYEPNDDGAAWLSAGGALGVRGDVRIAGHPIDGNYGVLAYNWYPNLGDMVIDVPDSFYTNTSGNSIRLRNVVAHEHGHGLGLAHSCPLSQTKLMEPYLSTAFDGPQHDDILATNRFYGDRFEHDDTPATAADLGAISDISVDTLSIDDNADTDLFSFSAAANSTFGATVTPVGMTYLTGPQNGDGSCSPGTPYDSLRIHDLALRVLDTDGLTELASADLGGLGEAEQLMGVELPSGAGNYYVEITGDSTNSAQLLQLNLAITPTFEVFSDGFETGDYSKWNGHTP